MHSTDLVPSMGLTGTGLISVLGVDILLTLGYRFGVFEVFVLVSMTDPRVRTGVIVNVLSLSTTDLRLGPLGLLTSTLMKTLHQGGSLVLTTSITS